MKTFIIIFAVLLSGVHAYSQDKRVNVRLFISPALAFSPVQLRVSNNSVATSNSMLSKRSGIFFGFGGEVLKEIKNDMSVGGQLSFTPKGYFKSIDYTYSNGSLTGYGFERIDLNFLQSMIFLEKKINLRDTRSKILFSGGLFYGIHLPHLVQFTLDAPGDDFGISLSAGYQKKRFVTKLDFQKGLVNINNNTKAVFKTNIVSLKIGYKIN